MRTKQSTASQQEQHEPDGLRPDQGFTLLELLVTLIIIGILSAIAIPIYLHVREKAADAATLTDIRHAIDQHTFNDLEAENLNGYQMVPLGTSNPKTSGAAVYQGLVSPGTMLYGSTVYILGSDGSQSGRASCYTAANIGGSKTFWYVQDSQGAWTLYKTYPPNPNGLPFSPCVTRTVLEQKSAPQP